MRACLLFVCVCLWGAGAALATDFRSASWGMTPEQVKKSESLTPSHTSAEELRYDIQLGSQPVTIVYGFHQGRLSFAQYHFTQAYRDSQRYLEAYRLLQDQLVRKYGPPAQDTLFCQDPFYKDFPHRWGTGIVVGRVSKESVWNTSRLVIRHSIRALPGGQVGHMVAYAPVVAPSVQLDAAIVFNAL